jgi:hypothetical protein
MRLRRLAGLWPLLSLFSFLIIRSTSAAANGIDLNVDLLGISSGAKEVRASDGQIESVGIPAGMRM